MSAGVLPEHDCGVTADRCPLLRTCACCGYRFLTARGRVGHQNRCPKPFSVDMAEAQHLHRSLFHTGRRRRR